MKYRVCYDTVERQSPSDTTTALVHQTACCLSFTSSRCVRTPVECAPGEWLNFNDSQVTHVSRIDTLLQSPQLQKEVFMIMARRSVSQAICCDLIHLLIHVSPASLTG